MANQKTTKALAGRLAKSKGQPVRGVLFAALETDSLTLSSFAARAVARDREVRAKLSRVVEAIQRWEAEHGQAVPLEVRPGSASIAVTAPPDFFTSLAAEDAVAVVDVDAEG